MRQLVFLDAALADFASILDYVTRESGSRLIGRNFVDRLQAQCRRLSILPGTLGRPRGELGAGIRSFACNGYVIFFRYQPTALEIINILEGHRDIEAHFDGDAEQPE